MVLGQGGSLLSMPIGACNVMASVIAHQLLYNYLRNFQLKYGLNFPSDIICLAD